MDEYEQHIDRAYEAQELLQYKQDNGLIYNHFSFDNPDLSWVAFFMAVHHIHTHTVYKVFREYEDEMGLYAVSREISEKSHKDTDGEHFHFCAQMKPETYHKLTKRLCKDMFNLQGRAKDGTPRQYGKVTEIKNPVRMLAYTIKDGDFITNIPEDELADIKKISFRKLVEHNPKKGDSFTERIRDELTEKYSDHLWDPFDYDSSSKIMDLIIDRLGDKAKVFDVGTLGKLFRGVQNSLHMSVSNRKKYKNHIKETILGTKGDWDSRPTTFIDKN